MRFFAVVVMVAMVVAVALAAALPGAGHALADRGTNVDGITFVQYLDQRDALGAIRDGEIDIYNYPVTGGLADGGGGGGDGVRVFDSVDGVRYTLLVNPAPAPAPAGGDAASPPQINPFSHREARYALNYLVDRQAIVDGLLQGRGQAVLSSLGPTHPDYLLVFRQLDALGIRYDPRLADSIISGVLEAEGAVREDGRWLLGGSPVTVKVFVRTDDPIRTAIGDSLARELRGMGLAVERVTGNLQDAFLAVFGSDPADLGWHIYTGAYRGSEVTRYDNESIAVFYAPWASNMPGRNHPTYWNYENGLLDDVTLRLYNEEYGNAQQRAEMVMQATGEAVREAVRIFLAVSNDRYAAGDGIGGIVNVQGDGIANRFTPINADSPDGSLTVGVRHIAQSAWNPVLGLEDTYSRDIWGILSDPASVRDPFTGDLTPARATWAVETAGPGGSMDMPADAVLWDPAGQRWAAVAQGSGATSRVAMDFAFGNWHNGVPMDINDVLYPAYLAAEWGSNNSTNPEDIRRYHEEIAAGNVDTIKGIRVLNDTALEVYTDYWHFDDSEIAARALVWSGLPWEVYAAMEEVVLAGGAAFSESDAVDAGVPWLSLLEAGDSGLVGGALEGMASGGAVPAGLYDRERAGSEARYAASIAWIGARGNAVISNGPFYLEGYDPGARTLEARAFDDPTYPLRPGHWDYLAAGRDSLEGTVTIGALAPVTGGASIYGAEIREASRLAVQHFNEYLQKRGAAWSLAVERLDSATDPATAQRDLAALVGAGLTIIDGPALDYDHGLEILDFANDNGMLLVSCCSVTTPLAQPDDAMFRMAPGHPHHAAALAGLMADSGITAIVPVGLDNIWISDLLNLTGSAFAGLDGRNAVAERIAFGYDSDRVGPIADLAAAVQGMVDAHGADRVAVLYIGFERGGEFLRLASQHGVLGDVRWFTADLNTASPNVTDDSVAAAFAARVGLTSVQPTVADNGVNAAIRDHFAGTDRFSRAPSVYTNFEYDAVWLLGLSMLETQSADAPTVGAALAGVAGQYVGASGNTLLNAAGDRAGGEYAVWEIADGRWTQTFPGTVWGTVYSDTDNDGTMDAGEPGIAGVAVTLVGGDGTAASAVTGPDGGYAFAGAAPGPVLVQAGPLPQLHKPSAGSLTYSYGTLLPGRGLAADFALYPVTPSAAATVTGKVYGDANGNTVFDGPDEGLAGVPVFVVDFLTLTQGTDVTDAAGDYSVPGVLPDSVLVQIAPVPAGFLPAPGQETYRYLTLPEGATAAADFVLSPVAAQDMASVGGTVYQDSNGNGVRDAGEPGIPDSLVFVFELLTAQQQTALTDANGEYSFAGVLPDTVLIQYVPKHESIAPTAPAGGFAYLGLGAGQSAVQDFANSGMLAPPVDTLRAEAFSGDRIDLLWDEPPTPAGPGPGTVTGYRIEAESPPGAGFEPIAPDTGTALTWFYHTGLEPGTEYSYRVFPITEAGASSASNVATAATDAAR